MTLIKTYFRLAAMVEGKSSLKVAVMEVVPAIVSPLFMFVRRLCAFDVFHR